MAAETQQSESARTDPRGLYRARRYRDFLTAVPYTLTGGPKNYRSFCAAFHIPPPDMNPRECEHMASCDMCRELWPMFLYFCTSSVKWYEKYCSAYEGEVAPDAARIAEHIQQVCRAVFRELPEPRRAECFRDMRREKLDVFHFLLFTRTSSSYVLFVKHRTRGGEGALAPGAYARMWAAAPPEEKQVFEAEAEVFRAFRANMAATLDRSIALELKRLKRMIARFRAEESAPARRGPAPSRAERRPNPWIAFLKERWRVESASGSGKTYDQCIREASELWRAQKAAAAPTGDG